MIEKGYPSYVEYLMNDAQFIRFVFICLILRFTTGKSHTTSFTCPKYEQEIRSLTQGKWHFLLGKM